MDEAAVQRLRDAPLALYGLSGDFTGARSVGSVGSHGDEVNLVELDHGNPARPRERMGEGWG